MGLRFRFQSRKTLVLVVCLLIVFASGAGFWWSWRQNSPQLWFSSATVFRSAHFSQIQPSEAIRKESNQPFSLQLEKDNSQTVHKIVVGDLGLWKPPVSLVEADENLAVDLPFAARIAMMTINASVITPENRARWEADGDLPIRFFDPLTFQRLPDETVQAIHRELPRETHGRSLVELPKGSRDWCEPVIIGFDFGVNPGAATEPFRFEQATVYDGRTHYQMGWSRPSIDHLPTGGQIIKYRLPIRSFRRTPIIVHLVVAHPPEVFHVPAISGTEFEFGPTKGMVIVSEPGDWNDLGDKLERKDEDGYTVALQLQDRLNSSAWSMRAYDENSQLIQAEYSLPSRFHEVRFNSGSATQAEDGVHLDRRPETLELKLWPQFSHLLFRVHDLPGLPVENYGVDNLFDAKIPFLQVDELGHLLELISINSQQSWKTIEPQGGSEEYLTSAEFPDQYFPHVYENVTVRDLLAEYQRYSPAERIWTPTDSPLEIHALMPPRETWLDRMRARVRAFSFKS